MKTNYESQRILIYSHLSKLLVFCNVFFWAQSITWQFLWSIAIISSVCSHHFWKPENDFFIKIICFFKTKPQNPSLNWDKTLLNPLFYATQKHLPNRLLSILSTARIWHSSACARYRMLWPTCDLTWCILALWALCNLVGWC